MKRKMLPFLSLFVLWAYWYLQSCLQVRLLPTIFWSNAVSSSSEKMRLLQGRC